MDTKTIIIILLAAVIGLGAGFMAGQAFNDESSDIRQDETETEKDHTQASSQPEVQTLQSELAKVEEENMQLQDKVTSMQNTMDELSGQLTQSSKEREAMAVRLEEAVVALGSGIRKTKSRPVAEIETDITKSLKSKDGLALIALLAELQGLGEDHYPDILQHWNTIVSDSNGMGYGLGQSELLKAFQGNIDVLDFGLHDPDSPMLMRLAAAQMLPLEGRERALDSFAEVIATEKHNIIMTTMLQHFVSNRDPKYLPALLQTAKRDDLNETSLAMAAISIAGNHSAAGDLAYRELELINTTEMRELLPILKVLHDPPADGILLTTVEQDGKVYNVGLRRADLIVKYNYTPVGSTSDLFIRATGLQEGEEAVVEINRDGRYMELNITELIMKEKGNFVRIIGPVEAKRR